MSINLIKLCKAGIGYHGISLRNYNYIWISTYGEKKTTVIENSQLFFFYILGKRTTFISETDGAFEKTSIQAF